MERWGESVGRKVRSGNATGLGRSAAGEGGGRVGAFDWTGEEKSAPELRRAIGSRCSGCQTFPGIDPRLQAHEKTRSTNGGFLGGAGWVSEHFIGIAQSSHFRPLPLISVGRC